MEGYIYHETKEFEIQYKKRNDPFAMPILHYHNGYELYLLEEGSRSVLVNDELYYVNQYDVILFQPNTFHRNSGGTAHSRTVIYFTKEYLEKYYTEKAISIMLSCFEEKVISLNREQFCIMKELIGEMEIGMAIEKPEECFDELLCILRILNSQKNKYVPNIQLENHGHRDIVAILSYITEHYRNIEGIDEIANAFFITKHHLCRIFKESTGLTITQYLNGIKVQKGCELLIKTKDSITEIGFQCGFNSTMYFCRIFKQYMGITPKEYRKK